MIDVPENAKYAENHDSQDHVQANPYNIHEVGEIPLKNATHTCTHSGKYCTSVQKKNPLEEQLEV